MRTRIASATDYKAELTAVSAERRKTRMRTGHLLAVLSIVVAASGLHSTVAYADTSPSRDYEFHGSDTHDDFGILLADMLGAAADVLSAHQDQAADESYLGSAASSRRLRTAIYRTPEVTLRGGARPLIEGWILGDD